MKPRAPGRWARMVEELETRRLLAVTVAVDEGDLLVTGQADGPIAIVATAEGTFQVTDNGVDLGSFTDVDDDVIVYLDDADAPIDDQVTVDLGGQSVDTVIVALGDGDNTAAMVNGTTSKLGYGGGDGADSLTLAADLIVERRALVLLGGGDNSLTIDGTVNRSLDVLARDGNDALTVGGGAVIEGSLRVQLGDGDNIASIAGQVGSFDYRGGADDDAITLLAETAVARSIRVSAGDGNNTLSLAGSIDGSASFDARDGNDAVEIAESATIGKDVNLRLGDGENQVAHNGVIERNFSVTSANEDDQVVVANTATVGGETTLTLGEQSTGGGHRPQGGGGPHGRGRHGRR